MKPPEVAKPKSAEISFLTLCRIYFVSWN